MTEHKLTATDYHRITSYRRHHLTPHTLDWAHQPMPVKRYPYLPRLPLDRSAKLPAIDYFDLMNRRQAHQSSNSEAPNSQTLSTVFRLTHDITARAMHAGTPFYYRSVASAGALYPFECAGWRPLPARQSARPPAASRCSVSRACPRRRSPGPGRRLRRRRSRRAPATWRRCRRGPASPDPGAQLVEAAGRYRDGVGPQVAVGLVAEGVGPACRWGLAVLLWPR